MLSGKYIQHFVSSRTAEIPSWEMDLAAGSRRDVGPHWRELYRLQWILLEHALARDRHGDPEGAAAALDVW